MNLKKRKHFTSKDLVLVKFYFNAAVRRFLKIFRTFAGKHLWCKPFLGKFKLFKMDSGKGFFISFPNINLKLLPNIEQKRILLSDNIVWCKYSRVIKDLSKSESLFLLNARKYLGARLFHSFYVQTSRSFWNVFLSKKKKKFPWNLKGSIAKITPH